MTIGTFTDAEPPVSGLARPGSRVLLAGTARHPDGSPLPNVPAVARSLTDLAAVLRDQAGIGAENLGEPLIDPSGPLALGQALDRVASEASDTLVVYYAGHGLIGSGQELYLATGATDSLVDGLDFKALSYRALLRSLQKSQARTVVVVLDCCFSDRGWPPARLPTDSVFERTLVHGGFLLTSAARDELALAAAGELHTRFTGALIGLLRDGDPAGPRGLTLEHVYRFLNRELPAGTPRPHRHSIDGAGELVLAPNPAYRFPPAEQSDSWRPGDSLSDAYPASGATPGAGPPCPFRGLRPFGPEDAGYFFGRDDLPTDWSVSGDGHLMAAPIQLASRPAYTPDTGIWDISGKTPVLDATLPVDPATAAFLGNASDALLTVDLDGGVTLWNITDPRHPVRAAALGSADFSDISQVSPGGVVTSDTAGTLTAVLGADGLLRLWRVRKGLRVTLAGSIPVPGARTDLACVLPDGQHAVIITNQGLQWWDIADPAHPARIGFSPMATANKGSGTGGGSLFAETAQLDYLCDCSKLDIFSLSGRHVTSSATLSGQAGGQLQVSSDGRLLASAGAGGNGLTLWDLRDPSHPRELAALQTVPTIAGITFSPNDTLLADWNEETLQLWNLRDPASPALVASIAFQAQQSDGNIEYEVLGGAEFASSGGTLAVSASYSVVFLDTDPAAVASRVCAVTGAAITRAQWQLYAPGIPYQNPCSSN